MANEEPTLGLVLSGGGARGLAHIGVLRVLERERIRIDYLAGTSMGGVIAAGFAAGMSSCDLEQEALRATRKNPLLHLADPGIPNGGLFHGERMLAYFRQQFGDITFAELRLPLSVVAVDLNTSQEVVLSDGPVALALRATTSLPGLFMPLEMNKRRLVDGGLLNNLPVDVVSQMGAEVIIAVDIGSIRSGGIGHWMGNHRWVPNRIAVTLKTFDDTVSTVRVAEQENKLNRFPPDVLVCPELPANVNALTGYDKVKDLVLAGERAMEEHLARIRSLVSTPAGITSARESR
jgi:NTE family protein